MQAPHKTPTSRIVIRDPETIVEVLEGGVSGYLADTIEKRFRVADTNGQSDELAQMEKNGDTRIQSEFLHRVDFEATKHDFIVRSSLLIFAQNLVDRLTTTDAQGNKIPLLAEDQSALHYFGRKVGRSLSFANENERSIIDATLELAVKDGSFAEGIGKGLIESNLSISGDPEARSNHHKVIETMLTVNSNIRYGIFSYIRDSDVYTLRSQISGRLAVPVFNAFETELRSRSSRVDEKMVAKFLDLGRALRS